MSLTAKEKTNKQQRHGLKAIKKKKKILVILFYNICIYNQN